ncbi:MAG: 5-(carboxyamino)imidazole ribonucleotide synthase [Henriciella sp.]|nr:5-(carboxyamino)imidazole ribonucleotide synthase [Henriciella sp.]
MTPLSPGSRIGILGGGQLGRMLAGSAAQLGFDVSILCPEADCPAARVAMDHRVAAYTDLDAVLDWARGCDVVTYEFENVPVTTAAHLIDHEIIVRPGAAALEVSQDRVAEKTFLNQCGIDTARFAEINTAEEIAAPIERFGGAAILKTRRDGYDGKGQVRLAAGDDYAEALRALGNAPSILEAMVPFSCEVSVIIARSAEGESICYDLPRNDHTNGILRRSVVPSQLDAEVEARACEAARKLADALDYVGVLALEFFVLENGDLLANEFAPRVHNSGHWTPEACATGQFEQHIRAIAGWPLGPVTRYHKAEMLNLLGDEIFAHSGVSATDGVLTLYGKRHPKPGRKMGHLVRRLD